jgi:uncharacterized protein (DUF58 family)
MITRAGIGVAAAAAVLGVAGALLDYPELVVFAVAGVGALAVAAAWMLVAPDVTVTREIRPARVAEGEAAQGLLTVTNVARRRSPPCLALEAVGRQRVPVTLPSLAPGRSFEAAYPLPTDRRGVFGVGPLTIDHGDPLRLVRIERSHASDHPRELRVHPRLHPIAPPPTGGAPDVDGPTSITAPLAIPGMWAFHSLREYAPGDDPRLIHWRSTARTGRLMVRHNVVPSQPRLMVVLDTSTTPYPKDYFEDAVRVAASLVISALDHGFPAEVRTTGGKRVLAGPGKAGRGGEKEERAAVLDLFAAVRASRGDPGVAALPGLARRRDAGADGMALGVVTGQAPTSALAAVSKVRSRFTTTFLIMLGKEYEGPAPPMPGALVVNVRTSQDFAGVWNARVRR